MKNTLIAAALVSASISSFADVTAFTKFDYDRANDSQKNYKSQQEGAVGVAVSTKLGTVDGAVLGRRLVGTSRDTNVGFEVGYSNGIKLGTVDLAGRVAFGRLNKVDAGGGGFTGNSEYYSLGAEASVPVTSSVSAFAGARHRHGMNSATVSSANRFTVGADIALMKNISVRAGYAFNKQGSYTMNGLTTSVSYRF